MSFAGQNMVKRKDHVASGRNVQVRRASHESFDKLTVSNLVA